MKDAKNLLPQEIDLLFDNKKLDMLKYLGILYYSKTQFKKRGLTFEQLLFYYSVVYYDSSEAHNPLIYKYVRDKKNLNWVIIYLDNLNLIKTQGDVFTGINKIKVSITDDGMELIKSWETEDTRLYLQNICSVLEKYPYSVMNSKFKFLLYKGEF